MDLLYFLRQRTRFVRYVSDTVVPHLAEIKRKIETGEEPYIDRRYYEDADEPAFLQEFEDADLAVDVIGMTCLGMLQSAFLSFLREYVKEVGGPELLGRVSKMKRGSSLQNFHAFFAKVLGIDWSKSGVDLALIEQVVLTRNDFQHNAEIFSGYVFQTSNHAQKYPDTAFRHPSWPELLDARLTVDRDKLEASIRAVEGLCEYLEKLRHPPPRTR
jgi:hypothetical protein